MSKFNQTKFSELINYQGSSTKNLKKFLRRIEKNQRNSINISNTFDKQRKSIGINLKLWEFRELKKEKKETEIDIISEPNKDNPQEGQNIQNDSENSRYYIRYFLNIYNLKTKKMYGNTYQSPYFEIKLEGDKEIKLLDPKPFNAYVLSPDPDNDCMIIQFIIIETDINDKDCIKSQTCERWALIPFTKLKEKTNEREINIVKGSPRYLLYNDYETIKKF